MNQDSLESIANHLYSNTFYSSSDGTYSITYAYEEEFSKIIFTLYDKDGEKIRQGTVSQYGWSGREEWMKCIQNVLLEILPEYQEERLFKQKFLMLLYRKE